MRELSRRGFLGSLIGAAVAPSLVWPFRKIFLPTLIEPVKLYEVYFDKPLPDALFVDSPWISAIEAVELEAFAKTIPDLLRSQRTFYEILGGGPYFEANRPTFRIPQRIISVNWISRGRNRI